MRVITKDGIKNLKKLKIGDFVLCEGDVYLPVKSVLVTFEYPIFIRTSVNVSYRLSKRVQLKTERGFKFPELWDTLITTDKITPMITHVYFIDKLSFVYDILIDGNMVSLEGFIFRYSN